MYRAFSQLKNGFFKRCFLLVKLVCGRSQNFSSLACQEDTFSDGWPASSPVKHDHKALNPEGLAGTSAELGNNLYWLRYGL